MATLRVPANHLCGSARVMAVREEKHRFSGNFRVKVLQER